MIKSTKVAKRLPTAVIIVHVASVVKRGVVLAIGPAVRGHDKYGEVQASGDVY